jgi:putative restriction endonuclease
MKEKVNQEQRAFLAWPILTECASTGQTITYGQLGERLNVHHRAIRFILGVIQDYCLNNELPPLTILVLNQNTGLPGDGFIAWDIVNAEDGLKKVHDFNWTKLENPFQFAKTGSTQEQLVESLVDSPSTSDIVYAKVKVRGVTQRLFRQALLRVYDYSCAICGLSFTETLEASHIIPYSLADSRQKLDVRNGLLLCSNHHKLFDSGYITINQDYTISYFDPTGKSGVHSQYDILNSIALHGHKISLPKDIKHYPNKDYLKKHQHDNE